MAGGIDTRDSVKKQYESTDGLNARIRLHKLYTVENEPFYQFIRGHIGLAAGERALECGAGDGSLWAGVNLPEGARLTLTDLSEGMAGALKERFVNNGQISVSVADVQNLPFTDGEFDTVIANHMLYHVPDMRKGVSEICRVLKKGGRLIASTIGDGNFTELWYAAGTDAPKIKFTLDNGGKLLAGFFSRVNVYEHESKLMITNALHAVEYMESMISLGAFALESRGRLFETIDADIQRYGAFKVSKRAGLFLCEK